MTIRPTLLLLLTVLLAGCASIPKGAAAIDDVSIEGNDEVSSSDIESKIATTESPKFLEMFRGLVYDYELFDRSVLQRDLERIERLYRAKGFYEAKARAGRVRYKNDSHVEVMIEVEEGPPVRVASVQIEGPSLTAKQERAIRAAAMLVPVGERLEEEAFNKAQTDIVRVLTNRGYAFAKVEQHADVDLVRHEAKVRFKVTVGPKAKFGKITVEGLKELPEKILREVIDIDPGQRYSTETIDRAREAVLGLGTFSSVEIIPQLTDPPPADASVPLLVRVHEQRLRSVLLGGGGELDATRMQFHLHAGWEHKNLFGGFRHFTVDVKPGIDLYPTRVPDFQAPTDVLPEEKFSATLRQPSFIEARTTGVITQEVNTYPLLLATKVDPEAPVLGYFEYKGSLGLERSFWKLFASPTYNFQYNLPFAYRGELDPNLTGIMVSYVAMRAHFDFRDDRLRPHKGLYIGDELQFAGLGGDARDFRVQPEVRGYIPIGKKVTLATRFTVGLLFPLNYGDAATAHAQRHDVGIDPAVLTRDIELLYLRGFFSGGPSSNRGYPLHGVGPHGSVPFFNPGIDAAQLANDCAPDSLFFDEARCGVPLGGMSLWEASLELRFPIIEPLGGAVFCDASDVSAAMLDVRFAYPHLSCGAGLRVDTPIGPVRADFGYRIPGAQIPRGADPFAEGTVNTLFGVPIALAFGIGEAF